MYVRTPVKFKSRAVVRKIRPVESAEKLVELRPILNEIRCKVDRALSSSVDYDAMKRILKEIRNIL